MLILLLAVSLSVDAFGTGLSYGIRKIKVPLIAKLIIAAFTFTLTSLSIGFGKEIATFLPDIVVKGVGVIILLAMGLWIIWGGVKGDNPAKKNQSPDRAVYSFIIKSFGITVKIIKDPVAADMDGSMTIEPTEALYVGMALSVDSLGVGLAASTLPISLAFMPLLAACMQLILLSAGGALGGKLGAIYKDGRGAVLLSGGILVTIAFMRIFN